MNYGVDNIIAKVMADKNTSGENSDVIGQLNVWIMNDYIDKQKILTFLFNAIGSENRYGSLTASARWPVNYKFLSEERIEHCG